MIAPSASAERSPGLFTEDIRIGVLNTQVGFMKQYGVTAIQGLKLGIEYATGDTWQVAGRTLHLLIEDDAGDPGTGVEKARRLFEREGVHILTGCASSAVALAVSPLAQEYRRLFLVEPAAADDITGAHFNRYVFRTAANVSQDAAAGGRYAVEHLGRTFYFLAPDYVWGQESTAAWKRVIERHGGRTVGEILVPVNTIDFTPYLQQIRNAGPEVLVQSWSGSGAKYLFAQMRRLGLFETMRVTGGLDDRQNRHALGLDCLGMIGICKYSYILPRNPANDWLVRRHQERHGEPPDLFTGGGFAAGIALVEGLRRTRGHADAESLIPALEGMSFDGPKGTCTFRREDHQVLQPMYIVEMVSTPDLDQPWAIPRLIREMSAEETAPPLAEPALRRGAVL